MNERWRRFVKSLALVAAGALLATSVFAVAAKHKKPLTPVKAAPDPAISVRDTGVGLPRIGSEGTLGIGEFINPVRAYHDSGIYDSDLAYVGDNALTFMTRQAGAVRAAAKRRCAGAKRKGLKGAKRVKACAVPKLAITIDIDETALSNYQELNAANFAGTGGALAVAVATADSPAIAPTLALYRAAKTQGIAVFAITGRPDVADSLTRQNLTSAGYTQLDGLFLKPASDPTVPFKSGQRAKLEQEGYRIVANVGDQESDLAGGHADRSFKLPNPFYFIK